MTKPDYSPLYIQNPFETELNVSKNISGEELVRIQEKIKTALWKLETSSIPSSNNIWGLLELFDVEELRDNDSMKLVRLPMAALFDKGTIHKLKDDMSKVAVPSLQLKPVSQTSESVNSNSNRPNPKKESLSQTSRNTVKKTDTVSQSEKSSREVRQTTRQVKKNVRQKILSKSWKF